MYIIMIPVGNKIHDEIPYAAGRVPIRMAINPTDNALYVFKLIWTFP